MALNRVERERVNDSRLKIHSITASLREVDPDEIPEFAAMEACLEDAEKNLRLALRATEAEALDEPPEFEEE
jgi:hypothetical protein